CAESSQRIGHAARWKRGCHAGGVARSAAKGARVADRAASRRAEANRGPGELSGLGDLDSVPTRTEGRADPGPGEPGLVSGSASWHLARHARLGKRTLHL